MFMGISLNDLEKLSRRIYFKMFMGSGYHGHFHGNHGRLKFTLRVFENTLILAIFQIMHCYSDHCKHMRLISNVNE